MHALLALQYTVACDAQLTDHDRDCSIGGAHYLASSVGPGKGVVYCTHLQVGDVVQKHISTGHTTDVSSWGDCEVHTELASTVGVLGYPLSVAC